MEFTNRIYRKGTESGQRFRVKELQKSRVSDVSNDLFRKFCN